MWKVNGRQDAKWWQKLTLPLARWAKKKNINKQNNIIQQNKNWQKKTWPTRIKMWIYKGHKLPSICSSTSTVSLKESEYPVLSSVILMSSKGTAWSKSMSPTNQTSQPLFSLNTKNSN